jgi:hypothetical protein
MAGCGVSRIVVINYCLGFVLVLLGGSCCHVPAEDTALEAFWAATPCQDVGRLWAKPC